ncbi:amino acid/polyamine transporter I [Phellopilus nigrolimitatus]|nr:amino acid/polyamine transporter I [Phellopilus nigrolimitatus]
MTNSEKSVNKRAYDVRTDNIHYLDAIEEEDAKLKQLGIRRELRKEFTNFSTLSFALGVLGCAASIASTINTPLLLGGPATAVWAWFLGSFGCLAIATSVAELVSAYPTSGGIYTSTAFVIPEKYRASVTFVTGWMTIMGQLATPASVTFALSQMIYAAVTIGTDGTFVASTGQILGLYVGLTVALGILNSLPTKWLHRITSLYVYFNILTTIAIIIAIPAAGSGQLASHKFVWTEISDGSGWNNRGFAFLLGLLSVQWVMTDYDGAAHLSEEVKNAAIAAPVAIISAVSITSILGFFVNVVVCYGIRDFGALPGPTGLVFSQILWDNLGKRGALALWSFVIIVQFMTAATCQLACIYAISRDNALPDRRLFARVWSRTGTPVNAVIVTVIVATIFGLLYLASIVAINAIFSITAVALDLSYMIPIIAKVCIAVQNDASVEFVPGPFYMGKWGYAVNVYAILWTLLETGILIMPQVNPVSASTMNYAGPIMGFVCGASWIWYKLYWHRYYLGPGRHEETSSPRKTSSELYEKKASSVDVETRNVVD